MTLERNLKIMEMFKEKSNEYLLVNFLETMLKIKIKEIEILPKENNNNIIYTKVKLENENISKIEVKFCEDIHIMKIPEKNSNENIDIVSILNENITDE